MIAGKFGAENVGRDEQAEKVVAFGVGQGVGLFQ
jgi:hypothetical protein